MSINANISWPIESTPATNYLKYYNTKSIFSSSFYECYITFALFNRTLQKLKI